MDELSKSQVERKKSYRWVSATKFNYDGSDWSDHNEHDSEDRSDHDTSDHDKSDQESDIHYKHTEDAQSDKQESVLEYLPSLPKLKIVNKDEDKRESDTQESSTGNSPLNFKKSTASEDLDNLMSQITKEISINDGGSDSVQLSHGTRSVGETSDPDQMMSYSEDDDEDEKSDDDDQGASFTESPVSTGLHVSKLQHKQKNNSSSEPAPGLLAQEFNSSDGSLDGNDNHIYPPSKKLSDLEDPPRSPIEDFQFKQNIVRHSILNSSDDEDQGLAGDDAADDTSSRSFDLRSNVSRLSVGDDDSDGTDNSDNENTHVSGVNGEFHATAPETHSDKDNATDTEGYENSLGNKSTKSSTKDRVTDSRANFIQDSNKDEAAEENNSDLSSDSSSDHEIVFDADGNVIEPKSSKSRVVSTYSEVGSTWNAFPSVMGAEDMQTITDAKTIYDNATIFNVPGVATNQATLPPLPVNKQDMMMMMQDQQHDDLHQHQERSTFTSDDHTQHNVTGSTSLEGPDKSENFTEVSGLKSGSVSTSPQVPLDTISKVNIREFDVSKVLGDPKSTHASKINNLRQYSEELNEYDTCISYWINDTLKSTVDKKIMENYKINVHVKHAYSKADELSKRNHLVANVNQNVHQLTKKVFRNSMKEKSKGFLKSIRDKK